MCNTEWGTILCGLQCLLYFIQYSCDVCEQFASTARPWCRKIKLLVVRSGELFYAAFNVSCTSYDIRAISFESVSTLLPQHGPGVRNKTACNTEWGTILCGLQRLLYFSIIPRIFIRRSPSENCSFHQNELLVSLSEHRSFLRRNVRVKNANLRITNLVTFFTLCTPAFQLLI